MVSRSGWEASSVCRRDQGRLRAPKSTQKADTGISLECCAELCDMTSEGIQLSLQQTGTTDHSEGPQVTNAGSGEQQGTVTSEQLRKDSSNKKYNRSK